MPSLTLRMALKVPSICRTEKRFQRFVVYFYGKASGNFLIREAAHQSELTNGARVSSKTLRDNAARQM